MKKRKNYLFFILLSFCFLILYTGNPSNKVEAAKIKKIKSLKFKTVGKTVTVSKKESKKLRVTRKPSNAANMKLIWTSSRPSVVSVAKNGVVTGRKKGTSTISARTTDGSNLKIKCKVTVGKKVKSVKFLNSRKLSVLKAGSTYKLKASISPSSASNKKLSWTSSNSSVVQVSSSGVVKAKRNGTAKITVCSTDGTNKKQTCKVKVFTPVSSVCLYSPSGNTLVQKGATLSLNASILPKTASKTTLNWSSSNPTVAIVNNLGVVTAVNSGVTFITAFSTDGSNKSTTIKIIVDCLNASTTKLVAHRGYSAMAPENSLAAFQLACQSNFWGVELDIWETIDHEFVVTHNNSLLARCGVSVNVTDLTLEQATSYTIVNANNVSSYPNQKIPALKQALDIFAQYPYIRPVIEIKQSLSKESLTHLLELLNSYHMMDRVNIISFKANNLTTIRTLKQLGGDTVSLQYLIKNPVDSTVKYCIENRIELNCDYRYVNPSFVSTLHANGRKSIVYTVNSYADAYRVVKTAGVDIITSDNKLF
ncbi:Ig-like domain-containing protein [Anaerosacchariphilus polymeriproducens]|nr:Ig-like domain-containing protein [Anaerosacchariphilus polymeriproducens]